MTKGDYKLFVDEVDDWNFLGGDKKILAFDQWPLSIEWLIFLGSSQIFYVKIKKI